MNAGKVRPPGPGPRPRIGALLRTRAGSAHRRPSLRFLVIPAIPVTTGLEDMPTLASLARMCARKVSLRSTFQARRSRAAPIRPLEGPLAEGAAAGGQPTSSKSESALMPGAEGSRRTPDPVAFHRADTSFTVFSGVRGVGICAICAICGSWTETPRRSPGRQHVVRCGRCGRWLGPRVHAPPALICENSGRGIARLPSSPPGMPSPRPIPYHKCSVASAVRSDPPTRDSPLDLSEELSGHGDFRGRSIPSRIRLGKPRPHHGFI